MLARGWTNGQPNPNRSWQAAAETAGVNAASLASFPCFVLVVSHQLSIFADT